MNGQKDPGNISKEPPSFKGWIFKWVYIRYGRIGIIILALLIAIFLVYKNWNDIKTWPGIGSFIAYISQDPIPKADPARFSILVAHLENDSKNEYERLVIEDLKEFDGIQVLQLDRTIPVTGSVPEKMEKQGYEIALSYLKQSGGSVLIWGTVLDRGNQTIPKLYWTESRGGKWEQKRYDAPLIEDKFHLPEMFWADLAEILKLLVKTRHAELLATLGNYMADQLSPFISRVRTLLDASLNRSGWDAEARSRTLFMLANALKIFGEQKGEKEPLEEAVAAYREVLKEYTRDRAPLYWAMIQNRLGTALLVLGERESGTARLEEAVAAYREALKEYTRERVPLGWATCQNNLGNALLSLSERENGTARLEEAAAACREALKERTRERIPLKWAMTQNNLGYALLIHGEKERGTAHLEEAAAVFCEALKIFKSAHATYYEKITKNNIQRTEALLNKRK